MSLKHLLAVGQSFGGGKKSPSPYKLTQQNLLPKFAPPGRTIGQAVRPNGEAGNSVLPAQEQSAAITTWKNSSALKAEEVKVESVKRVGKPTRAWWPFRSRKTTRNWVQGELALENVKVVRNDLTDADIEVVQARAGAVQAPAPEPVSVATSPAREETGLAAGLVWNRLSARLFMSGRT